jgi:hypothetical protein
MKRVILACLFATGVLAEDTLYHGETSENFVIRWAFQNHCHHVFDLRTDRYVWPTNSKGGVKFDPEDVQPGDIIFVRQIELFFQKVHPFIKHPYIGVTHGEHLDEMKEEYLHHLDDDKVIAWFGIHACKATHPKFTPIPLGVIQEPDNYKKRKGLHSFFKKVRQESVKEYLVYMNFADLNKPVRKYVRSLFAKKSYCKRGARQPFFDYLKEMATCKFALSPEGLAIDCYRTWEAMLVGSIPIVIQSQLDPLFEGLPILIVDHWDDITQEFLEEKYQEITSKSYDLSRLYMEYWTAKIDQARERFLARVS